MLAGPQKATVCGVDRSQNRPDKGDLRKPNDEVAEPAGDATRSRVATLGEEAIGTAGCHTGGRVQSRSVVNGEGGGRLECCWLSE